MKKMDNNKLLTMCSSRVRPSNLVRMINTFNETKNQNTKLVVYVSNNDPKIDEYKNLEKYIQEYIEYGPYMCLVDVLNYFCVNKYPEYDFYHEIHDDHMYMTKDWDIKMIETINEKGDGWGACCANDNIDPIWAWRNPGASVISGNIIKALGYWFLPGLRTIMTDTYYIELMTSLNSIWHRPDIMIDHVCWHDSLRGFGARAPEDENTKNAYSEEELLRAQNIVQDWRINQKQKDINKILQCKELKGSDK